MALTGLVYLTTFGEAAPDADTMRQRSGRADDLSPAYETTRRRAGARAAAERSGRRLPRFLFTLLFLNLASI